MKKIFSILKKNIIYIILLALVVISTILVLENIQRNKSNIVFEKEKLGVLLEDSRMGYGSVFGKEFSCNPPSGTHYLKLNLSKNDTYRVEFLNKDELIDYMIVKTNLEVVTDNCTLLYLVPEHVSEESYTSIKIYPIDGDENYHVYFLDIAEDTDSSEDVDFFVDFEIEKLELEIDQVDYEKIARDRQEALELSIHLSDGIYVPAKAYVNGEKFDTEVRLKGDWTDHMRGENWSLRIKVDDDCIWGMSEFSIQDPNSRKGIGEYLIQEYYRNAGGVALRYDFVDVVINGTYMGVYAVEEGFTKRAVENSLKREGVIIKPNEDQLWEARAYYGVNSLYSEEIVNYEPFSMNKTLKDDKLYNYAAYAINNINSVYTGDAIYSEVFDVNMFAKYYAILDLLNSYHGSMWHNIRYYYNPVTGLLEPVTFDEIIDSSPENIYNYKYFVSENEELSQAYFEYLYLYAEEFDDFMDSKQTDIAELEYLLSRYNYPTYNYTEINSNVELILESKNEQGVDVKYTTDGNKIIMEYVNNNIFPIKITDVYVNKNCVDFTVEDDRINSSYDEIIDEITVEYVLANLPNEKFSTTAKKTWSFYVAGHAYGAHADGNDGIHTPFLEYFDEISSDNFIEFGVLTGDTVFEANQESFNKLKDELAITNKPYYIAAGNHCLAGGVELFESNFGDLDYYFEKDNNLFVFLVPGENWSFSEEQMDLVDSALANQSYNNVFIFMHYLAWAEEENVFATCGLPNSWTTGKSDKSNFWSEFITRFDNLNNEIYFIAGDVGAFSNPNLIYENIENYHFVASGMGNRIMDNILIVSVDEYANVSFEIKIFEENNVIDGGDIEDYKNLEVNSIDEIN